MTYLVPKSMFSSHTFKSFIFIFFVSVQTTGSVNIITAQFRLNSSTKYVAGFGFVGYVLSPVELHVCLTVKLNHWKKKKKKKN